MKVHPWSFNHKGISLCVISGHFEFFFCLVCLCLVVMYYENNKQCDIYRKIMVLSSKRVNRLLCYDYHNVFDMMFLKCSHKVSG
jgi:hypothetical protein